jgi:hypothetical protein
MVALLWRDYTIIARGLLGAELGGVNTTADLGYSEKLIILAVLRVACCVTGHLTNYVARITLAV